MKMSISEFSRHNRKLAVLVEQVDALIVEYKFDLVTLTVVVAVVYANHAVRRIGRELYEHLRRIAEDFFNGKFGGQPLVADRYVFAADAEGYFVFFAV